MVIGLTGPKLSGKGTAAEYWKEKNGAVQYSMSGILSDILDRLYLPKTRMNMIHVVTDLRERFGEDILAQVLKQDIENAQDKIAIIDGIRMPSEVELFSQLPGFQLVYIDAPTRTRYERALQRGEKEGESDMSFEEFEAEENAVTEQNIRSLREKAAVVIENTESLDDFYAECQKITEESN